MATYRRINVMDNNGVHVVHFVDKKIVDSGTIEQLGDELTGFDLEGYPIDCPDLSERFRQVLDFNQRHP